MHRFVPKTSVYLSALLILFVSESCKKRKSDAPKYDLSYTGSQYLGGTLYFSATAPAGSTLLWNFGDSTTSADVSPAHSYLHSGAFKVSLTVNGNTPAVITKTIFIGADSARQASITGTRTWNKLVSGYNPSTMTYFTDTLNDTSLAVFSIGPGVILFMADTMSYYTSTDSTVIFSRTYYWDPSSPYSPARAWSTFTYNYITNKMRYTYEYHVSAAGGNWTNTYISF